MARSEWIAISEARDALATRFYDHVAADWLVAYQASWLAILGSLIDGELPSVSESPNDFKWLLVNASGDVVKSMSLESELIPTDFWWHHREASKAYPIDIVLQSGDGAHSSGDDFWFEQSWGLGDGLIMRGHVQNVQVHLARLPRGIRTKRQRGRPPGEMYDDAESVKRVIAAVSSGTMTKSQAIKCFAPEMGGGGTAASKESRLRDRLRAAGFAETNFH